MALQNGGEEIRQEKWRKKVEKWWRNYEEMQWRKVKWGRRRPRHKAIYPPPILGYIWRQPSQKALQAVYGLRIWPEGFTGHILPVIISDWVYGVAYGLPKGHKASQSPLTASLRA